MNAISSPLFQKLVASAGDTAFGKLEDTELVSLNHQDPYKVISFE